MERSLRRWAYSHVQEASGEGGYSRLRGWGAQVARPFRSLWVVWLTVLVLSIAGLFIPSPFGIGQEKNRPPSGDTDSQSEQTKLPNM